MKKKPVENSEIAETPEKDEPSKTATRTIGGMEKTKWGAHTIWKCPRCNGTTFKEVEAENHTC